ncbi:unnamed protein product [Effrenium voratum]|uniref:Uncharacterized protein n=1 Tax=Effrenium voratum TaxID=2562239 RepID=A0AA36IHH6_9DINO|nr:unnamed protein product [Effrenium voratum]CAJ1436583.1 unnamed protein product [Effrenium voratum]CAJ1454370.1 unnamed protein product [Effrenium voratum]
MELAETKQRFEAVYPALFDTVVLLHSVCLIPEASRAPLFPFAKYLEDGRRSVKQAQAAAGGAHIYFVRSFGRAASFRRMTCGLLEQLLPNLSSCRLALAADDPDLDVYKANAGPWSSHIILGVKGAERQIAFIDQICRKGSQVMVLDDNILKFMDRGEAIHANLDEMVARGFKEMWKAGAKTWSGSDSPNPAHWSEEVDVGNGLVYGAAFGMVATHEPSRYSRFGQVMDDIERSCRFYEHDGATVRLGRFQVYKRHAPGLFHRKKGGISASLSADGFAAEAAEARLALLQRFPVLLQPADTKLGLKFKHGKTRSAAFIL